MLASQRARQLKCTRDCSIPEFGGCIYKNNGYENKRQSASALRRAAPFILEKPRDAGSSPWKARAAGQCRRADKNNKNNIYVLRMRTRMSIGNRDKM